MAPKLQPDGKPMRALRALAEGGGGLLEYDVWRDAGSGRSGQHFYADLRKLVRRGLAERFKAGGSYRYQITPAGREYLAAIDSNGPGGDSTRPGAVTHTREDPLA